MRLIDADKLKEELIVNGLGYQYYMLDYAPTVKAIPIEWIAKQRIDTDEQGAFTTAYLMLIEKWREENEIDRCR